MNKNGPEFTSNWFDELTAPLWREHFMPIRHQINRYLEIGCWEGASVLWVVEHLHVTKAITIDPFVASRRRQQGRYNEVRQRAERNLANAIKLQQIDLVVDKSLNYLRSSKRPRDGEIDLVFVDGSHEARDAMEDMVLTWPLLRTGGVMVLDDIQRRWLMGRPWTHQATRSFLDAYETLYDKVYETPKQMAIRKR